MSEVESELQRILAELDRLNERLGAGKLTAAEATEILEQVTQLTSDAVAVLERRTEALEE
jgi:predicted mannosyl-3-phosphoglycerate phosphatase (HAD superfamily)